MGGLQCENRRGIIRLRAFAGRFLIGFPSPTDCLYGRAFAYFVLLSNYDRGGGRQQIWSTGSQVFVLTPHCYIALERSSFVEASTKLARFALPAANFGVFFKLLVVPFGEASQLVE